MFKTILPLYVLECEPNRDAHFFLDNRFGTSYIWNHDAVLTDRENLMLGRMVRWRTRQRKQPRRPRPRRLPRRRSSHSPPREL